MECRAAGGFTTAAWPVQTPENRPHTDFLPDGGAYPATPSKGRCLMLRCLAVVCFAVGLAGCSSVATGSGPAAVEKVAPAAPAKPTITHSAWFKYAPWNSALPEVKKTGTGLEYVVLASGPAAGVPPTHEQSAKLYYEGRLNSGGRAFDSGFDRGEPDVFGVYELTKGFAEALTLMRPGDRWLIYVPAALGYGDRGYPGLIGPGENLLFEILMVGVEQAQ